MPRHRPGAHDIDARPVTTCMATMSPRIGTSKAYDYGTPLIDTQPGFNNKSDIFSLAADVVF